MTRKYDNLISSQYNYLFNDDDSLFAGFMKADVHNFQPLDNGNT